ncbi:hypothetical protein [Abyssicoccus albus]|uniref:Uncharacterized protein n=1 Tax=Abyssicoccus albus TaxID=1817405 RepID=A0A3N5BAI8_9BACL|nr:hypothetical protein [Abyssicoccus albus]RPF54786.1 hypothetical protein EDD62_1747 [Abyssicoccus albus]
MKTKELLERVGEIDFVGRVYLTERNVDIQSVIICGDDDWVLMSIRTDEEFSLNSQRGPLVYLTYEQREELMKIVWEYTSTPKEERENIKEG